MRADTTRHHISLTISIAVLITTSQATSSLRRNLDEEDNDDRIDVAKIQGVVGEQVQNYWAAAESKASEFYQSSPSEWTESQWDFILIFFGSLLGISCCCLSALCAYCCFHRSDDDVLLAEDQNTKRRWQNRLKRYRSRYREERSDDDTLDSEHTFNSSEDGSSFSSSVSSVELTKNDRKESLLKKSERSQSILYGRGRQTKGTYECPKNSIRVHHNSDSQFPDSETLSRRSTNMHHANSTWTQGKYETPEKSVHSLHTFEPQSTNSPILPVENAKEETLHTNNGNSENRSVLL